MEFVFENVCFTETKRVTDDETKVTYVTFQGKVGDDIDLIWVLLLQPEHFKDSFLNIFHGLDIVQFSLNRVQPEVETEEFNPAYWEIEVGLTIPEE